MFGNAMQIKRYEMLVESLMAESTIAAVEKAMIG